MIEENTYLKRGKGKAIGDVKKSDFYTFYKKKTKEKLLPKPTYNAFLKDLLQAFSEAMILENLEIKITQLGKLRIKSSKLKIFNEKGEKNKGLKVDWKACWDYWTTKYQGLSRQEIVNIKDKILVYHDNEHTEGEFYSHFWDKHTSVVKFKVFYKFEASRQYSRMIAQVVKDPNRKIFYYG